MTRLRRYFSFRGRAGRLEFWRFQVVALLVVGVTMVLALVLIPLVGRIGGIALAPVLPTLVASVAIAVRRLHDRGKSAWWLLVFYGLPFLLSAIAQEMPVPPNGGITLAMLLPSLASLVLTLWGWVEIGFLAGKQMFNRYGADPLGKATMEEAFT